VESSSHRSGSGSPPSKPFIPHQPKRYGVGIPCCRAKIPYDENGDIENVFSIPPDWTIEILSPDQSTTKVLKNINHCLAHGTKMGWLIIPADRSVFVIEVDKTIQIFDEPTAILPVPEFAASIQLTVEQLFSWIKKKV
jgi:Uma2 family endonuclease